MPQAVLLRGQLLLAPLQACVSALLCGMEAPCACGAVFVLEDVHAKEAHVRQLTWPHDQRSPSWMKAGTTAGTLPSSGWSTSRSPSSKYSVTLLSLSVAPAWRLSAGVS